MKPPRPIRLESVVAYTRYSSDMQRDESIEAQLRAIYAYAEKNGMRVVHEYIDKAKTATNDKRPEFQRMVIDSQNGKFTKVLVHKYDRFSRNMEDAIKYMADLKKCGVEVISTMEQFDDSPMGGLMRYLSLAMADMFSKNLSGEVEKGKRENAYKGMHVGGVPPLGYDVDRATMKLTVNEKEAEAVRLIFTMYLEGQGYGKIIDRLNLLGYKTKRGQPFGRNSLHEILHNEKYTGTYVYNLTAPKSADGKFNRHQTKTEDKIIRVPDAHPALVSKEDFDCIALKMKENRKNAPSHTAKEVYLLSGKVICGECGSRYNGINRPANGNHPQYISYRCARKNGGVKCKNPEIRRETLELLVLDKLANDLFSDEMSERIYQGYAAHFIGKITSAKKELDTVQEEMTRLSADIDKVVDLMIETNSTAISERLASMEARMEQLKDYESDLSVQAMGVLYKKSSYLKAVRTAKKQLAEGKLSMTKDIISRFVDVVTVYKDHITVALNFDGVEDITRPQRKIPQNTTRQDSYSTVFFAPGINPKIDTVAGGDGEI